MIRDFKLEDSSSSAAETISQKPEKSSLRSRGSSSPFRCIVGLVQQMKLEKDQELTMARVRVEELESLLAVKQREVQPTFIRLFFFVWIAHRFFNEMFCQQIIFFSP